MESPQEKLTVEGVRELANDRLFRDAKNARQDSIAAICCILLMYGLTLYNRWAAYALLVVASIYYTYIAWRATGVMKDIKKKYPEIK